MVVALDEMQLKIFYDHGQTFKTVRFEDSITVQVFILDIASSSVVVL